MHKKIIRNTVYFYTTVREFGGKTKTIYLGKTEEEAKIKEAAIKKHPYRTGRESIISGKDRAGRYVDNKDKAKSCFKVIAKRGSKDKNNGDKKDRKKPALVIPFISFFIIVFMQALLAGGQAEFFSYYPDIVEFQYNASWNPDNVFITVTFGNCTEEAGIYSLLKNSSVIVNLDEFACTANKTGVAQVEVREGNASVAKDYFNITAANGVTITSTGDYSSSMDDAGNSAVGRTDNATSDTTSGTEDYGLGGYDNYELQDTVTCTSCSGCSNVAATANRLVQLTQDISFSGDGLCINITASNLTFDCQGHTITGPLTDADTEPVNPYNSPIYSGAWVHDVYNVTLKNCIIKNVYKGIVVQNVNDTLIYNNTLIEIYSLNDSTGNNEGATAIDINTPYIHNLNVSYNTIQGVYANHSYWDSGEGEWVGFQAIGITLENALIDSVISSNIIRDFRCQSLNSDCKAIAVFYAGGSSNLFQNVDAKKNVISNITSDAPGSMAAGILVVDANITSDITENEVSNFSASGAGSNAAGYIIMTTTEGSFVNLSGNSAENVTIGFYAAYSSGHLAGSNDIAHAVYGYYSNTANNWTVRNNDFSSCSYGLYLSGDSESKFEGNTFEDSDTEVYISGNSYDLNFTDELEVSNIYVEAGSNLTVSLLQLGNSTAYANFTNIFINNTVDTQNWVDFQYGINSFNLSATSSPGLNKSAVIVFPHMVYASLADYDVIKNGVICGIGQGCTKLSYNPVSFSVAGFSNYTTQGEVGCNSCATCDAAASNPNTRITLVQDISTSEDGVCINVTADNVTFECNGYSITGAVNAPGLSPASSNSEYIGIKIKNANNVTIDGCIIQNFFNGISVEGTNLSYITNNTIRHIYSVNSTGFSSASGIVVSNPGASNVHIINNTIDDVRSRYQVWDSGSLRGFDAFGISVERPLTNGTIMRNEIRNVHCESEAEDLCIAAGFAFSSNSSNVSFNNNVVENITSYAPMTLAAGVAVGSDVDYMNGEIKNNMISGVDSTASLSDYATAAILALSHPAARMDVQGNTINNSGEGIYLDNLTNYTVAGNYFIHTGVCFNVAAGSRNMYFSNNTFDYCNYAISLNNSRDIIFINSTFKHSVLFDVALRGGSGNITFERVLQTDKIYIEDQNSNLTADNLRLGNSTIYANYTTMTLQGPVNTSRPNFGYSSNSIFMNASMNEGLNITTNIVFSSASYPSNYDFKIAKDGWYCPNSTCRRININPVIFQVDGFSNYSLENFPECGDTFEFGSYTLTDNITCGSLFTFEGDEKGAIIVVKSNNTVVDCNNHYLKGPVSNASASLGGGEFWAVEFAYNHNVTLKNCIIVNSSSGVESTAADAVIENNVFRNFYALNETEDALTGVWIVAGNNSVIRNNLFEDFYAEGSHYDASEGEDVVHNVILFAFGNSNNRPSHVIVQNNTIRDLRCNESGCASMAFMLSIPASNYTFDSNTIERVFSYGSGSNAAGMYVSSVRMDILNVTRNVIKDIVTYGSQSSASGASGIYAVNLSGKHTILLNNITNTTTGIKIGRINNEVFRSNRISNLTYAFSIDKSRNISVADSMHLSNNIYAVYANRNSTINITLSLNYTHLWVNETSNVTVKYLVIGNPALTFIEFNNAVIKGPANTSKMSIAANSAEISSSPGLSDVPANITFLTVSYSSLGDYDILADGALCTETTTPACVKINYNPVKFRVSGFGSVFTTQQHTEGGGGESSGGTSSGGGSVSGGVSEEGPECGNKICEEGEDYENCPEDCEAPTICGNNICEEGEDYENCPEDCEAPTICGNNICEEGEDKENCPEDCKTEIEKCIDNLINKGMNYEEAKTVCEEGEEQPPEETEAEEETGGKVSSGGRRFRGISVNTTISRNTMKVSIAGEGVLKIIMSPNATRPRVVMSFDAEQWNLFSARYSDWWDWLMEIAIALLFILFVTGIAYSTYASQKKILYEYITYGHRMTYFRKTLIRIKALNDLRALLRKSKSKNYGSLRVLYEKTMAILVQYINSVYRVDGHKIKSVSTKLYYEGIDKDVIKSIKEVYALYYKRTTSRRKISRKELYDMVDNIRRIINKI